MKVRQTLALLIKDAQAHGRMIGVSVIGTVVALGFFSTRRSANSAVALAATVLMWNVALSILAWCDWLIGREKTKGTWGWLRTLPIDETVLVGEKYLAHL